jgi:hypothetical protein
MLIKNLISNFSKFNSYDSNVIIHNYILSKDYVNLHKLYYHDLYYNKSKKSLLNNLNFFDRLYEEYVLLYPNLKNDIINFDSKYHSIDSKYCKVTKFDNKNFDKLIYERSIHYNILYNNMKNQDIDDTFPFHDLQYNNKNIYDKNLYDKIYLNVYLEIKKSYVY